MWATLHGAWEVLALSAVAPLFVMLAEDGAAAGPAVLALPVVLAETERVALSASPTLLAVLAELGAAAGPALCALLVVLADAATAARRASGAPLVVRALLVDAPPDWVRRRGGRAVLPELLQLPPWREMAAKCCKYG